jgi:surface antigen
MAINYRQRICSLVLLLWIRIFLASDFSLVFAADDYPFPHSRINEANNPFDAACVDPWKFFNRECTSFVAWRINRDAGTMHTPYFFHNYMYGGHWGNAGHWAENAQKLGYTVDNVPEVGAIVHFGSFEGGAKRSGHVSYVEQVNPDNTVNLSEYCWTTRCGYGVRNNVRAPRFIHINKFRVGDSVQVTATVNVREVPGGVPNIAPARRKGEIGTIIEGPKVAPIQATGIYYRWYKIRWGSNETGWSIEVPLQRSQLVRPAIADNH